MRKTARGSRELTRIELIRVNSRESRAPFSCVSWANLCALIVALLPMWSIANAETQSVQRTLSLRECIALALDHNLELQIARYNPRIAQWQLALAYSAYEPDFSAGTLRSYSSSPGGIDEERRIFAGTETDQDSHRASIGGAVPLTGLTYDIGADLSKTTGTGPGGPFAHAGGSVSVRVRQPLLRGSWMNSGRLNIQLSKKDLQISEQQLRSQLMEVITRAELAYYDLILARQNLEVQRQALELAEKLLAGHQKRVEVGLLAGLDEKQAEAQVATRQAALQSAQQAVILQEYQLKEIVSADFSEWLDVEIVPEAELAVVPPDVEKQESWRTALENRPELLQAKYELEQRGIFLKYRFNQLFPQLDLVASYGFRGSDALVDGVLDDIGQGNSPFHSYGLVLSIPIGNTSPRKSYQIARAQEKQSLLRLKQLEQSIIVQVGSAIEQVNTAFQRVGTTRKARVFAEMALNAEERRLENGKSTTFVVLQLQRDVTAARSSELQSLIDYNRALAQLALREGTTLKRHHVNLELTP